MHSMPSKRDEWCKDQKTTINWYKRRMNVLNFQQATNKTFQTFNMRQKVSNFQHEAKSFKLSTWDEKIPNFLNKMKELSQLSVGDEKTFQTFSRRRKMFPTFSRWRKMFPTFSRRRKMFPTFSRWRKKMFHTFSRQRKNVPNFQQATKKNVAKFQQATKKRSKLSTGDVKTFPTFSRWRKKNVANFQQAT